MKSGDPEMAIKTLGADWVTNSRTPSQDWKKLPADNFRRVPVTQAEDADDPMVLAILLTDQ